MNDLLTPLQRFVDASGQVLVLHDVTAAPLAERLTGNVVRAGLGVGLAEQRGRWAAVVLVVADVASLRRATSLLPALGRARVVGIALLEADRPLSVDACASWPLSSLHARLLGTSAWTVLRFFTPAPQVRPVFEQAARGAAPGGPRGNRGTFVAVADDWSGALPPADSSVLSVPTPVQATDAALDVPPDVVLTATSQRLPEHEVIARAPVTVTSSELVGPVDEGVVNPSGFQQYDDNGDVVTLSTDKDGSVRLHGPGIDERLEAHRGATARAIGRLRPYRGVRIDGTHASKTVATVVAGLAVAGVPMTGAVRLPGIGSRLGAELGATVDLHDPLRREEHSVRLRRAALAEHSTLAWRGGLARAAGWARTSFPSCSVVLATRREHQLDFAIGQFTRQRGVDAELVLATHGFTPDPAVIRRAAPGREVTVVPMPAEALFGDVLNAGVAAATGHLIVKMDDDDWYGPDFLTDLLWARHYSAADVTGMSAEFVYLEEIDLTIRRTDDSERTARFVAGGTMMLERAMLGDLGGFRSVRRYVDASLLASVSAAGGTIYRTHGLGYVLRRAPSGHTWDPGLDFFLDDERLGRQWKGFQPSRLLEHDHDGGRDDVGEPPA